jgi:hypothetical protein
MLLKTEGRGCDFRSGFGVDVGRGRLVDRRLSLGESSKRSKAELVSSKLYSITVQTAM